MKVVQVNSDDQGGGAAKIAYQIYRHCLNNEFQTKFIVGRKYTDEEDVDLLSNDYGSITQRLLGKIDKYIGQNFGQIRGSFILRDYLHLLSKPEANRARKKNRIDNFYPGTEYMSSQAGFEPDILHLHNLHGKYFDLSALPKLSSQLPVIWTLHDEWPFTGICAYTLGCERWKSGCGNCPQIGKNYSKPDATAYNWEQKRKIYNQSSLIVCTPSKWLYEKAKNSILDSDSIYHIPNGVNTSVFKPNDKEVIRKRFNIEKDEVIILFTANKGAKSSWKDYTTVVNSAHKIAARLPSRKVRLINPGHKKDVEVYNNLTIQSVPYVKSEEEIAQYYQMSDLYLHAANAENLPLAILEAMACGIPTVASNIGGIPEIIEDGESGFLVDVGDSDEMSEQAVKILQDSKLHTSMSNRSREIIIEKYSLDDMLNRYLNLYGSVKNSAKHI